MNVKDALDLRFEDPDSGEEMSIRDYFKRLLSTLYEEGEGFSGKRPFGNSGWEGNLELPLVRGGCIGGNVIEEDDDFFYVENVDNDEYDAFVQKMIDAL